MHRYDKKKRAKKRQAFPDKEMPNCVFMQREVFGNFNLSADRSSFYFLTETLISCWAQNFSFNCWSDCRVP